MSESAHKPTPIPVQHETSSAADRGAWSAERRDLLERLDAQHHALSAERARVETTYAARLEAALAECACAQQRGAELRKENEAQLALLVTSRGALSELKQRYEGGVTAWATDRRYLEAKAKQVRG